MARRKHLRGRDGGDGLPEDVRDAISDVDRGLKFSCDVGLENLLYARVLVAKADVNTQVLDPAVNAFSEKCLIRARAPAPSAAAAAPWYRRMFKKGLSGTPDEHRHAAAAHAEDFDISGRDLDEALDEERCSDAFEALVHQVKSFGAASAHADAVLEATGTRLDAASFEQKAEDLEQSQTAFAKKCLLR